MSRRILKVVRVYGRSNMTGWDANDFRTEWRDSGLRVDVNGGRNPVLVAQILHKQLRHEGQWKVE